MQRKKLTGNQRTRLYSVFSPMLQRCESLNEVELKTLYELGEDLGVDVDSEIQRVKGINADKNPFGVLYQQVSGLENKTNELKANGG